VRKTGAADTVARHYDRISTWYQAVAARAERGLREEGVRFFAPRGGERVLEIGFGTGNTVAALAREVGDSGRVFGVDISVKMCSAARARVDAAGVGARVELFQADAVCLPLPDGSVAGIFMSFALELLAGARQETLLGECARVLAPDGRICVVSMSDQGRQGLMMRLYRWAGRRFPRAVDCVPLDAVRVFDRAGFEVDRRELRRFWGLSVEIVLAHPCATGAPRLRAAGSTG
jgi:ubiquinone/menaquinone biosynthesis C-methylase UbiE